VGVWAVAGRTIATSSPIATIGILTSAGFLWTPMGFIAFPSLFPVSLVTSGWIDRCRRLGLQTGMHDSHECNPLMASLRQVRAHAGHRMGPVNSNIATTVATVDGKRSPPSARAALVNVVRASVKVTCSAADQREKQSHSAS